MNNLEIGKSYTTEYLLGFLSQNRRKNIFIASLENMNLLSIPRSKKFTISDIQSIYIHRFSDKDSYMINNDDDSALIFIKPE